MSSVQFKLMHGSRMYRFTPTVEDNAALLMDIKQRVDDIVKDSNHRIFWNNGISDVVLDSTNDLAAAMEYAQNSVKRSNRAPWIQLSVKSCEHQVNSTADEAPLAEPIAEVTSMTTPVQFKFMHDSRMHRFTPSVQDDTSLLNDIKQRVSEIVYDSNHRIFWNDGKSDVLLDSTVELVAAMDYANNSVKRSNRAPWIQLSVKCGQLQTTDEIGRPMATVKPFTSSTKPRLAVAPLSLTSINEEGKENGNKREWLLLSNGGNDCFLNAALQYMRRAKCLKRALDERQLEDDSGDLKKRKKEEALMLLWDMLSSEGNKNPREFREVLPTVINLEPAFLTAQQDAYEILTKIFDDVVPEYIGKKFCIESARRRRCKDDEKCKGCEHVESGVIHYQHIGEMHQIIDLESLLSSSWTEVAGENEPRHCSACCECCRAAEEGHDEDKCEKCKEDKRNYVEEQRFSFTGDSQYAFIAFNILHTQERVDWALSDNCKMDGMNLMGNKWKAVAVIKHIGAAGENWSYGHYVAYSRQDDARWWLHDDDKPPRCVGGKLRIYSGHNYPYGVTDMQGVLAILFEKIQ